MKDFIFRNDTKLFFRNDIRETVTEVAKGHKVMFVYGGGSVKHLSQKPHHYIPEIPQSHGKAS